jgi:hypothetical protein
VEGKARHPLFGDPIPDDPFARGRLHPAPTLDKSESRSADLDGFTILAVVTIPRLWDLKKVGALP